MKLLKVFLNQYFWLTLIIFFGLLVRLYKIDAPLADWHSWRQADTAAVTRNFIKMGFNPFFPKYDDMSGVSENPVINPATFRFVEFPIYNMLVYPLYLLFGIDDKYHRLVSVIFSVASIALIFFIVKKYANTTVALITSFTFAFLPFNVFFGRTTLPEPTFVFFALGMVYFADKWIWERGWILASLGFIFTAIAFLMKPWAIFFFLPLLYSMYRRADKRFWGKFIMLMASALLPFVLWRLWMLQQPEGIPASNWLLNGDGIRFRPAFWWWIISERIGREILGVTGAFLFFLGLLIKPRDGNYFLHIWALSLFLYFITFATGNVRHDYYQIVFVPVAAVFVSIGFIRLIKGVSDFIPRFWSIPIAFLFLTLTIYFTWTQVKELYKVNNPPIIEAGKKADEILPEDAVVVAPYMGDTAFLYQINRIGFPVTALPLPEMVSDYGVTHYVSVNRDDKTNWVLRHFEILEDNPKFVIADLTKIIKPLSIEDKEP